MNIRKKIINELRFQLDSKEVKDQHYPVQLSASDANEILTLLKEQIKPIRINTNYEQSWKCGQCGSLVNTHFKYCHECGRRVKWE